MLTQNEDKKGQHDAENAAKDAVSVVVRWTVAEYEKYLQDNSRRTD
jgi:hypothetical protein